MSTLQARRTTTQEEDDEGADRWEDDYWRRGEGLRRLLRVSLTLVLTGVVLVGGAQVASARPGNAPLVHVSGSYRITDSSGEGEWDYARADEDLAMTVSGGTFVEVRWGGVCTINGAVHRSRLGHHATCG